jgi:predicted RNA-binding protein
MRTPGKIKYQTHMDTYRKRENFVQALNGEQQVYLIPDKYKYLHNLYGKIMRRPPPVNENLHRKNITFSPTYQHIKIIVTKT